MYSLYIRHGGLLRGVCVCVYVCVCVCVCVVSNSCLILWDSMDSNPLGSSVHGIS